MGADAGATRASARGRGPGRERALWRCASALVLLWLAAACADGEFHDDGLSSSKFLMGSRYGRSPTRWLSPRNDRFFMGPRYGKRSQPERLAAPLVPGALTALTALAAPRDRPARAAAWLCEPVPAGSPRLYQCAPAPPPPPRCRTPDRSSRASED